MLRAGGCQSCSQLLGPYCIIPWTMFVFNIVLQQEYKNCAQGFVACDMVSSKKTFLIGLHVSIRAHEKQMRTVSP